MKKIAIILFLAFTANHSLFAQAVDTCKTFTGTISQIKALHGKQYCFAASTNYGTGSWYRDTTDVTAAEDTALVLIDADGKRWKRIYTGPVYVDWYGAVPDSVTDCTTAIQSCFRHAKPHQTISFGNGTYKFGTVSITDTDFTITGSKSRLLGTITVGDDTPKTYNSTITGLTFNTAGNGIQLENCRKLEITENVFNNCDKAIYVVPISGSGKHTTGIIEITGGNLFNNVNYCFYADRYPTNVWNTTNDCTFSGNVANNCNKTAVYCNGIDGLKYSNNTIFTPTSIGTDSLKERKLHHLQIDTLSDMVVVNDNNFFESGQESILLTNCKDLTVTGNNFAWSGQSSVYSVIRITGYVYPLVINVTGNIVNGFSGNVVQIDKNTYGAINVAGNNINYSNTFTDYFGSTDLSTIHHYVVNAQNPANSVMEKDYYNSIVNLHSVQKNGIIAKYETKAPYASSSTATDTLATSGSTPVAVVGLYSSDFGTATFGGTLNITVKSSLTSTANTANYVLMINRATGSSVDSIKVISKAGLTGGGSSSQPSFNFTATGNTLYATPVGSTSGTFYFFVQAEGDLVTTNE